MNAAGVDPAVVEIEQRADGNGVVNGLVCEAGLVKRVDVRRLYGDGIEIDFVDKAEQRLFRF